MKSVHVKAVNLKVGDVLEGQGRIKDVHVYTRKNRSKNDDIDAFKEVLVIVPSRHGYRLNAIYFIGHNQVIVKRPLCNMEYRRCERSKNQTSD